MRARRNSPKFDFTPDANTVLFLRNGSFLDQSGKGNNPTNNGGVSAVASTEGLFASMFSFSGTNYLTCSGDNTDFKTQNFTVHAYVKTKPSGIGILFCSRKLNGTGSYSGFIFGMSGGTFWAVCNNGGSNSSATYAYNTNKFNLMSCTYDGTTLKIFLNGEKVAFANQILSYAATGNVVGIGTQDGTNFYSNFDIPATIYTKNTQSEQDVRAFAKSLRL